MPAEELEQSAAGGMLPKPCVTAYPDIDTESRDHIQACHFAGLDAPTAKTGRR